MNDCADVESGYLRAVWTRLPSIPGASLEFVTCGGQVNTQTSPKQADSLIKTGMSSADDDNI